MSDLAATGCGCGCNEGCSIHQGYDRHRNPGTGRRTGRLHSPGRTPAGENNGRQDDRPAA